MKTSDFLCQKTANSELWLMRIPVISTTHMQERDDTSLLDDDIGNGPVMALLHPGYLLCIDDLTEWTGLGYSDAFLHLLETFHRLGFHYLRLDPDGATLDDLPTFDW